MKTLLVKENGKKKYNSRTNNEKKLKNKHWLKKENPLEVGSWRKSYKNFIFHTYIEKNGKIPIKKKPKNNKNAQQRGAKK